LYYFSLILTETSTTGFTKQRKKESSGVSCRSDTVGQDPCLKSSQTGQKLGQWLWLFSCFQNRIKYLGYDSMEGQTRKSSRISEFYLPSVQT